jgi:hypothetical protein
VTTVTLPFVCAWCARTRTDGGRWESHETEDLSGTPATHGICPECLEEQTRAAALALALECQ